MSKIENTIAGINKILSETDEYDGVLWNILTILKNQEPVEPIFIENPYTHLPVSYCSQCREPIGKYIVGNPYKMTKFCHYCGKAVKWNEQP